MQLTKDQRVLIVTCYTQTRSYKRVKEVFTEKTSPSKSTINATLRKCNNMGTLLNLNKGNNGRLKTIRNGENNARVREIIEENPNFPSRRNPSELSRSSFMRFVGKDQQFHPYKISLQQMLLDADLP